jgi:hypothetical protein
MRQAGAGMLSATEKTRLAAEEMGVRLPRAMVSLIGQSKAAQAALSALSTVMIGFATIQIGAMVGTALYEGAKKLYEKWLDVDGAIRRYNDEAGQAASKRFYEDAGLDQLNADLVKANQQLDQLNQKRVNSPNADMGPSRSQFATPGIYKIAHLFGASTPEHFGVSDANAQNAAQGGLDAAQLKLFEETHKKNLQQIEDNKLISEAKVTGIAKARAAQAAENNKADEDQKYAIKRAQTLADVANRGIDNKRWYGDLKPGDKGYREAVAVSPDTGKAENADAKAHAAAELQAQQFEIGREHSQELVHLREQALEAGLRGIALYRAQEAAAIEDLKFKDMDSTAARAAVHAKFHAEELKRLEEENRAVAKMHEQTQLAGLTGTARIKQENQNRINDVYASTNLNPGQRMAEINEINKQTAQQIGELNKTFTDRVDDIVGRSATRELQGFARIRADAQNQIRDLQKDAGEHGGTPADLARGEAGINAGAAGQARELTQKNSQETAQIEEQARVKFLSAEKQKTAAIGAELAERKQKYLDELNSQEISQDDYNRRVAAAQMQANAQMIEAATEARKKMAGEFTSFFEGMEHPGKYFAKLGDKAAGEAAASLFQRFQSGKGRAGIGTTGGAGGVFGDVLGGMGFGGFGKKGKTPGAGAMAETPGGRGAGQGTFSVASATIHIGSATIMGGGGVGPGGGSGGAVGPGGSTTLLAHGATGATGGFGAGAPSTSAGATAWSAGSAIVGGAGAGVAGSIASGLAEPGVGPGASKSAQARGALGDVSQGVALTKQLGKDFSGQSGNGKSGGDSTKTSSGNGSMTSSGFTQGNVTGAVQGGMGVWGAHESGGGVGGGLKGAMSGAEMGMEIAGPMGALVGAAAGAVVGAIGSSHAARDYDLKTVRPRIAGDLSSYHSGGMNYLDAYSDAQSLQMEAAKTTQKMGSADSRYYQNTIKPEIKEFMGKLDAEQKSGRSMYTTSAASYATGTPYVPETGLNMNHAGERIFSSVDNSAITKAVTEGNGGKMPVQSTSMGDVHLHVHAIDAKGVSQFLDKYKHNIRSAVNDSYAENSGGGMN